MKFAILKTSDRAYRFDKEKQPCENAKFCEEEGEWTIEINSLEELLELAEKQGEQLVITHNPNYYTLSSIEIYDDFRE